jgi:NAD(P)H-hydrate epimerase
MGRLIRKTTRFVQEHREKVAKDFAVQYNVITVLKGHRTVVASPHGKRYINDTGNPGMATAGIGDALTGVIAAFLAQGLSPLEAALAGTYVHGTAGDLAASEKGHRGLITRDLIEKLPAALCQLEQFQPGEFEETAPV